MTPGSVPGLLPDNPGLGAAQGAGLQRGKRPLPLSESTLAPTLPPSSGAPTMHLQPSIPSTSMFGDAAGQQLSAQGASQGVGLPQQDPSLPSNPPEAWQDRSGSVETNPPRRYDPRFSASAPELSTMPSLSTLPNMNDGFPYPIKRARSVESIMGADPHGLHNPVRDTSES